MNLEIKIYRRKDWRMQTSPWILGGKQSKDWFGKSK